MRTAFSVDAKDPVAPVVFFCAYVYFASLREIARSKKAFTQRRKVSKDAKKSLVSLPSSENEMEYVWPFGQSGLT
jgi:hypothetical protein